MPASVREEAALSKMGQRADHTDIGWGSVPGRGDRQQKLQGRVCSRISQAPSVAKVAQ